MATRAILVGALLLALLIPVGGSAGLRTAPKATGQPQVSGSTVQGQTLRTGNGSWSGRRTPSSGGAATRSAAAAPTSPARPRAPTFRAPTTSATRCASG